MRAIFCGRNPLYGIDMPKVIASSATTLKGAVQGPRHRQDAHQSLAKVGLATNASRRLPASTSFRAFNEYLPRVSYLQQALGDCDSRQPNGVGSSWSPMSGSVHFESAAMGSLRGV